MFTSELWRYRWICCFYIWTEPIQPFPPVSRDVVVASIFSSDSLQENTILVFFQKVKVFF